MTKSTIQNITPKQIKQFTVAVNRQHIELSRKVYREKVKREFVLFNITYEDLITSLSNQNSKWFYYGNIFLFHEEYEPLAKVRDIINLQTILCCQAAKEMFSDKKEVQEFCVGVVAGIDSVLQDLADGKYYDNFDEEIDFFNL